MPRGRRSAQLDDSDDEEMAAVASRRGNPKNDHLEEEEEEEEEEMQFTQQCPEMSQPILPAKASERSNLDSLGAEQKRKIISDLSRLVLFKALAGEPIDRAKCIKEALGEGNKERVSTAAFEEAAANLRNVFGFQLCRVPKFMQRHKNFPSKFKDRYYVINLVEDDEAGSHSKSIHSVHPQSSIEKGFLMVVLAFCFCKGEPESDGSRWVWEADLYRLLHGVDENLPPEPPEQKRRLTQASQARARVGGDDGQSLDVDMLLEKFVKMDYLLRRNEDDKNKDKAELKVLYSMGPKAALEIGRKQVVHFCAELLDEEPDPTMMAEIDGDFDEDDDE